MSPLIVKSPSICKLPTLSSLAISELALTVVAELPAAEDLKTKSPPAAFPVLVPAVNVISLPAAFVPELPSTVILSAEALSVIIPAKVVLLSPILK